jgi:hypothetical protein
MNNYYDPQINNNTIASRLNQGVQIIDVGPGGHVTFNNCNNNNGYYNIGFDYGTVYPGLPLNFVYYQMYSRGPGGPAVDAQNKGWGVCDIRPDGTIVHLSDPGMYAGATHTGFEYWWEPGSSKWIPWAGTEAQFNTRFSATNSGRRKCHATYELFRDNLKFKFLQNGAVAQTEEYKTGERISFISSLGVHRTNIQDLYSTQDVTIGSPKFFLEDQPIKTVPATGGSTVKLYWDRVVFGTFSVFDPQRPLGTGVNNLPELVSTVGSHRMGTIPKSYPYWLDGQNGGTVPAANIGYTPGPYPSSPQWAGVMFGLDLGSSVAVSNLKISLYDGSYARRYGANLAATDTSNCGRLRVYHSDDNTTWTETTECRFICRDLNAGTYGTTASIVAGGGAGLPDITGLTGFTAGSDNLVVGQLLTIFGAASPGNNGVFPITQVNSATSVRINNPSAVIPDGANGAISWNRDIDPGYKYVNLEKSTNQVDNTNGFDSGYNQITFDLLAAGISAPNRTHRYWKVVSYTKYSELGGNVGSVLSKLSYFSAFGDDGYAIGVDPANRFPEAGDPNVLSTPIKQLYFIQDRIGISGKGGINTVPDAFADGFTDTVTIASGTFDTGVISAATDYLAYRNPTTGTFLKNSPGNLGNSASLGEQTQVKILSVIGSTIVVSKRNIPDNLSAADWEVRRPYVNRGDWPYNPGDVVDPFGGGGYMQFHDSDAGREFRLVQRCVNYRP